MLGVKAASLGKMGSHTLDGATHTDVTSLTEAKGDILVYTGSTWDKLAIGTNNKILIRLKHVFRFSLGRRYYYWW
mgnify:CR=1 FL=1